MRMEKTLQIYSFSLPNSFNLYQFLTGFNNNIKCFDPWSEASMMGGQNSNVAVAAAWQGAGSLLAHPALGSYF